MEMSQSAKIPEILARPRKLPSTSSGSLPPTAGIVLVVSPFALPYCIPSSEPDFTLIEQLWGSDSFAAPIAVTVTHRHNSGTGALCAVRKKRVVTFAPALHNSQNLSAITLGCWQSILHPFLALSTSQGTGLRPEVRRNACLVMIANSPACCVAPTAFVSEQYFLLHGPLQAIIGEIRMFPFNPDHESVCLCWDCNNLCHLLSSVVSGQHLHCAPLTLMQIFT